MEFVATGNATAELVATVLVPLCDWLGLYWVCENPVTWQIAVFRRSSPQKIILFI
jgi:predicted ATP-grasp superfamily ATP-dependent carboligase